VALAGALLSAAGCAVRPADRLVVATSWPAADRRRIEAELARWLGSSGGPSGLGSIRLDWLILDPGDDPARVAQRHNPPDVLLGGPAASFDRLARGRGLAPLPLDGAPAWAVARRGSVEIIGGGALRPRPDPPPDGRAPSHLGGAAPSGPDAPGVALDDPRNDPISLAWAKGLLGVGPFRRGYSRLVHEAGHSRRIGRTSGSARAALRRGEARSALAVVPQPPVPDGEAARETGTASAPWIEGVAIPRDCRHPEPARAFLRFLAASGRAGAPQGLIAIPAEADALLADLLGATLVDAQDELWAAWSALERSSYPEEALRWMTEPPPWPPASVAALLGRQGERAVALPETLANQLATEPAVRAWLVRSWLAPPRPIDGALLEELAAAAEGRLVREPRVRDWLRAEWTAWARQRYRRVARLAASRRPADITASRHRPPHLQAVPTR
jgi:hypothetical protein